MSRRSLLTRIVALGTGMAVSVAALGRGAQPGASKWDFGAAALIWEPLELATGNTLLVSALVGDVPVRAVLDSGSGMTTISTTLAAKLSMGLGEERMISGLSAKVPVRMVRDVAVSLGRKTHQLPFAIVADLSSASAGFGRVIDMLVGADVFTRGCIALDFGNRRISVAPSGTFRAGAGWKPVAIERGSKQELIIRASVAGLAPAPLMLDLGSSSPLMLSSTFAREQGLLTGKRISTAALGGVDGVKTNDVFTTTNINIEGLGVSNISTVGMRHWLPTGTVGNIGLPLIAQFDVVIDVTAGFAWFRPLGSRQRLPMLKDRSGLGFAASPSGLTIVHVAANSPAELGGCAVGDRIVTVNGEAVDAAYTHGDLWRWRFGPVGVIVKLDTAAGRHRTLQLADYY